MLTKMKQHAPREANTQILACFFVFLLLVGLFCLRVNASENSSKIDHLAEIDSGFFVSKDDVYGLRDQAFREKLLMFLTENGILTKSSRGLIYYHISEDAIAKIEDPEFKKRLREFITDSEKTMGSPQKALQRVHEVQTGETLWTIAQRYGMSLDEIVRLNRISPSEPIYPGQKILVTPDWH